MSQRNWKFEERFVQRGSDSEEDRPFVVSTLRVKRKKEKKMERKEGVWSKRRVSFRTSLMRNNNVAYTSTPSGCRLPSSRLYSSGVFFEYSSFYPRPSTHYFASATDHEKNCTRIARIRVSLENWRNEKSFVACFAHPSILSCGTIKWWNFKQYKLFDSLFN